MADEEDEGGFGGLYEDGHWVWDDSTQALIFIRWGLDYKINKHIDEK